MKKITIISIYLVLLVQVGTTQTSRNFVVFELAQGVTDCYSPAAVNGIMDMLEEGLNIIPIAYHTNAFSVPQFYTTETISRVAYYGITAYPTVKVDGILTNVGGGSSSSTKYTEYLPLFNQRTATPSPFSINSLIQKIDDDQYVATISIEKVGAVNLDNLVLQMVLTESKIQYSWCGMTELNWVTRDMIPNQNGTLVDFSGSNFLEISIPFTFDNINWNVENCDLMAFIQDNSSREILQATKSNLNTLKPPTNLQASLLWPNSVSLSWNRPLFESDWLYFCGNTSENSIGLQDGGTFFVSAHWNPSQIAPYDNFYLNKISIFPTSSKNAEYSLKVWQGTTAGTLLIDQPLTNLIMNEWNEIALENPVMIDGNIDLWVGYSVTHAPDDDPVGMDAGPAIAGNGDMVSVDGITWESLSLSFGLNYNFSIKAFVTEEADGKYAEPLIQNIYKIQNTSNKFFIDHQPIKTITENVKQNELTGYNIYRNNSMIGYISDPYCSYLDLELEPGDYSYEVRAVYEDGLSSPAGPIEITVPTILLPDISIFPGTIFEIHNNPPQVTTKTVTVSNIGVGSLDWTFTVNTNPTDDGIRLPDSPEAIARLQARMEADGLTSSGIESVRGLTFGPVKYTDDNYDLQFEYPCGDASGEAGTESDGNYIYTTKWNGSGFFKYELDGTFLGAFQVGTVNAIRDLAYDGTYFYGAAANTSVYEMDFNTNTVISQFNAGTATRAIAYDEGEDGFWSNNWSTPIVLWDRSGAVLNTIATAGDESYYGFAYDPQGPYLWGYSQKVGTSANMLYKMNLPGGTLVDEFDMLTILSSPTAGTDIAGGLYFQPDLVQGYYTLGGIVQNICIWGVEMGTTGPPITDVGVQSFVSPVSGPYLGNETVTIKVKNFGTNSVSNIPVSYTLDGGAAVTGTLAGPIAPGATADFTFPGTVNLSNPGQAYLFVGCTALASDENPNNNCKTANVTHVIPTYCDATTQIEDEYIASVLCGDINNSSGWQGDVADYTDISTHIDAGMSETITITNGYAWTNDIVYCWADWNKDFTFGTGDEQYMLINVGGAGQTFEGTISVPVGVPNGEYRFRIRMTYSTAPVPCGHATYGEVEDYTIVVGWLSADILSGSILPNESTNITLTLNSENLATGQYFASLMFSSNDPDTPLITVPVELTVGCIAPVNLSASNITQHSADLEWDAISSETTWEILYGLSGFNPETSGTIILQIEEMNYTLNGLNQATYYDFYVRSNCGDFGISPWVGPVTFKTLDCVEVAVDPDTLYVEIYGIGNSVTSYFTIQNTGSCDLVWEIDTATIIN